MKIVTYLGWKTLLLATACGLLAGWLAYATVPFTPRVVIPFKDWHGRLIFSKDCRLVAWTQGSQDGKREWHGEIRVWDTLEQRLLFSIAHTEKYPPGLMGGYSLAFTAEGDKLVVYAWGEPHFFHIPSGKPWHPEVKRTFPRDGQKDTPSWMVSDAQENLFVLIRDNPKKTFILRDLWTDQEVGTFLSDGFYPEIISGALILQGDEKCLLRELPSGKLRLEVDHASRNRGPGNSQEFTATPDCRTLVHIDGSIHVWSDGVETVHHLPAHQFPILSPDGQLLAVSVHANHGLHPWLTSLFRTLGILTTDSIITIYDLTAGRASARLPQAILARFSLDGKTLVIMTDHSLELHDLPLHRSWGTIGGGLGCASVVFLGGQWFRWRRRQSALPPAPLPLNGSNRQV